MMKIAYDAKRFFNNNSGLGNYSRDLVRILSRYYPENQYFLLNKNLSEKVKKILDTSNVHFQKIPKGSFSRQLKMGIEAQNLEADIVHGLSGELPLNWNKKPIKKIVTIHDLIFIRFPQYYSFFDRKIHYWKFKKASDSADKIIAISEQTKRDIIEFFKVPESKIQVIYQGCHEAFKKSFSNEYLDKIKEKFDLPKKFILNVGTIEERKNLLSVVKALKNTNIPLVVVGKKTDYWKKIEKEVKKNNAIVKHLKNVSMAELATIYRLANIFIYPSLYEGFGIPIIEALFSKIPVITSNLSCLPEAGGPDSCYIDPRNIEDIRAKILFLWNNEFERKRRAEKGLQFAQKFDDCKIAEQVMKLYCDLSQ